MMIYIQENPFKIPFTKSEPFFSGVNVAHKQKLTLDAVRRRSSSAMLSYRFATAHVIITGELRTATTEWLHDY